VVHSVDLVHAPLSRWAQEQADRAAIRNGTEVLTFAQLHEAVLQRSETLQQARASACVFVDQELKLTQRIVEFLSIIASGRCAAVGDADWPDKITHAARSTLDSQPADMPPPQGTTPFYIGYTSGSTGNPKGYQRHHRSWTESFRACLDTFGPDAASCILAPGRDSHSLFLFGMMLGLWTGAGVVVQEKFSAAQCLETLASGSTPCLVAVPSQLLLMLELAAHRKLAPIPDVRLIMVSGARWSRSRTADLKALFPQARIIEFYGASEMSFIAWMDAADEASDVPVQAVGKPFANVEIEIRPAPKGLIYVRSPMVFMDYVGAAKGAAADASAALRDGDWLSVRDVGMLDANGWLCLEGRENRMIVTNGKNLFPEELEGVLETHAAVAQASVHGLADAMRGTQVVAVVRLRSDVRAAQLGAHCRAHLESFKAPRHYWAMEPWPQTPGGKTDHRAIAQALQHPTDSPCLLPLH
jgi:acyl-CoA synthetase (AMP-forming)/AMP-acid ligase II